ncbi:MAG: YHS domain-containing (seleno)protein [Planctomycetota bacterium]
MFRQMLIPAVALVLTAFTAPLLAGETQAPNHTTALGLAGYSPVSYFADAGPHVGSPEFAATHDGVTYFFADADELSIFEADPERYAPAYGGWCAYGMAVDNYFPVNPKLYKIVDGRLFLFLNNDQANALELWNAGDEAELTQKADAFWTAENAE